MPASTPVYGLPYQVGSDPPCFGPGTGCDNLETLWCDFAEIVETQLDTVDTIIGRTGTSIPMAKVLFAPDITTGEAPTIIEAFPAGYLAFDTVQFDTDNMATLPQGITPRRNGRYRIDASIQVSAPLDVGLATAFRLVIGGETGANMATLIEVVPSSGASGFILSGRASTLYEFSSTAPIPRVLQIQEWSLIASDAQVLSGSMSVYWHSDL